MNIVVQATYRSRARPRIRVRLDEIVESDLVYLEDMACFSVIQHDYPKGHPLRAPDHAKCSVSMFDNLFALEN